MHRAELLMRMYEEQTTQARQHESLRVNFVSILLTFGSILLAVVGYDSQVSLYDIPILIFLFFVGVFGYVASLKHYERNRLHVKRAKIMREMAEAAIGADDIGPALYIARKEHEAEPYLFLKRKVRVKTLWALAPLLLSVTSVVMLILVAVIEVFKMLCDV